MRIDCEVYLDDRSLAGKIYGIKELLELEDEAGVDVAVIMPKVSVRPPNKQLAEAIQGNKRFIGCAFVNPQFSDEAVRELEVAIKEWGFKGLKLMPTHHGFRIASKAAHPLMRKARELKIPVTIHSGTFFCYPLEIAVLAEEFPDIPIIMDHMGYRYYTTEAIIAAKKCKNIYLATTAVAESYVIKMAVDEVGPERVVFGSNAPQMIPAIQVEIIKRAGLKPEDEELVLGKNLARLYNLT